MKEAVEIGREVAEMYAGFGRVLLYVCIGGAFFATIICLVRHGRKRGSS